MMNHSTQRVLLDRIKINRSFSRGKGEKVRQVKLERPAHQPSAEGGLRHLLGNPFPTHENPRPRERQCIGLQAHSTQHRSRGASVTPTLNRRWQELQHWKKGRDVFHRQRSSPEDRGQNIRSEGIGLGWPDVLF